MNGEAAIVPGFTDGCVSLWVLAAIGVLPFTVAVAAALRRLVVPWQHGVAS
jgi:hypothetical protein